MIKIRSKTILLLKQQNKKPKNLQEESNKDLMKLQIQKLLMKLNKHFNKE